MSLSLFTLKVVVFFHFLFVLWFVCWPPASCTHEGPREHVETYGRIDPNICLAYFVNLQC